MCCLQQLRHVHVQVPEITINFAENIGRSLQCCARLDDMKLSVGGSATSQMLEFCNTQLKLKSPSKELVVILLQLNPGLLHKVVDSYKHIYLYFNGK